MARLDGQVALVTGGASGLGRAIVDRFVAEGAQVAVLDRSQAGLDALRRDHGARIAAIPGDVRSIDSNRDAVARGIEAVGQLDCAIANAGLWDYSRALVDLGQDAIRPAFH